MADQLNLKELMTIKELLMSEVIQSDALINLLDRKGIITKKELLEEINRVQTDVKCDFVYVDEESFGKYKPTSFKHLMEGFKEYKGEI